MAAAQPIVFLDVDGVLCLDNSSTLPEQRKLEPASLQSLKTLCDACCAAVVVSSDWRRFPELQSRLLTALKQVGVECVGCTPQRATRQELRPVEIREWLAAHEGQGRAWVALDDRFLPAETGGAFVTPLHFVSIDPRYGLTPALAEAAARQIHLQHQRLSGTAAQKAAQPAAATATVPTAAPTLWAWVDVDGTSETGSPFEAWQIEANKADTPPLGEAFNYNASLFDVLVRDVGCESLLLFTAYDSSGAASTHSHAVRAPLIEWLEDSYAVHVEGVATPLDAIYARGVGAYYRDVIAAVERAALASASCAIEGGRLPPTEVLTLGTGEQLTLAEVQRREGELYDLFSSRFGHAPDKEALATYCLKLRQQQPPYEATVLFLDDRTQFLDQVGRACARLGVPYHPVHVQPASMDTSGYRAAIERTGLSLGAAPVSTRSKRCSVM